MINMLRKGIKFSIQRVYFPQSYFESKRFNSIGKFKLLTFQLRAIYFHTFAVDMSVFRLQEPLGSAKQRYFFVFCVVEEVYLVVVYVFLYNKCIYG